VTTRTALAIAMLLAARGAAADPLRLRADALATTASPAGLLVLETDAAIREGMSAEAVVWMAGARTPGEDTTGDVLVIAVRARALDDRAHLRLGRFVSTLGALRPVHVDGVSTRVVVLRRFEAELVGGVPVMLGLATGRGWDWMVGGRVARRIGDGGSVGIAYGHRRDAGALASEELAADAGLAITTRADAGARVAYDLANPGLAEVKLSTSYRRRAIRAELYGVQRSASHLLPATSLFSVIGDVPSRRIGTVVTWRAAPRLDVIGDAGARVIDDDVGAELTARARLRLNDRGTSMVSGELRRGGIADDAWSGIRGTGRLALPHSLAFNAELELVIPDVDRGGGAVWPWALGAVTYDDGAWLAAVAVEASASPEYRHRVDVLGQLGRRWGK
jgi:hypothetical protein